MVESLSSLLFPLSSIPSFTSSLPPSLLTQQGYFDCPSFYHGVLGQLGGGVQGHIQQRQGGHGGVDLENEGGKGEGGREGGREGGNCQNDTIHRRKPKCNSSSLLPPSLPPSLLSLPRQSCFLPPALAWPDGVCLSRGCPCRHSLSHRRSRRRSCLQGRTEGRREGGRVDSVWQSGLWKMAGGKTLL